MGNRVLVPTPINGATLVTRQEVSGSSTVSFNNVFTPRYVNYSVIANLTGTNGANVDMRLRANGVDDTTASAYVVQRLIAASATASASTETSNIFNDAYQIAGGLSLERFTFYQPQLTTRTWVEFFSGINGTEMRLVSGLHTQGTSFDGFSLIYGQNVTGTIWIYGLGNTL